MSHIDDERLTDYVAESLPEDDRIEVDTHLAECDRCLQRVRRLITLRDRFDDTWTAWTAVEHGELRRSDSVLQEGGQTHAIPKDYLQPWTARFLEGTFVAIRVWIDRGKQVAALAGSYIPGGFEFELRPAITGVGSPGSESAIEERIQATSNLLAEDRFHEAEQEMNALAQINQFAVQTADSIIYRRGQKYAEVYADALRGVVYVKQWAIRGEPPVDTVMLIPRGAGEAPRSASLEPVSDEDYRVAQFDIFADGNFEILFGMAIPDRNATP